MFHLGGSFRLYAVTVGLPLVVALLSEALDAQVWMLEVEPALTIGALDGHEGEIFGDIVDLAVDQEGHVFVLDGQAHELRWFDPDGQFRGRAGRRGQGPGEFIVPRQVEVDSEGRIHVLDQYRGRISSFGREREGLQFLGDVAVMPGTSAFCVLEGGFLILAAAADGNAILHEVDDQGNVKKSFADPIQLDPTSVEAFPAREREGATFYRDANQGEIVCDVRAETVVLLHQRVPLVRAFSFRGDLAWETRLRDYWPLRWEPAGRGGRRMAVHLESGTAHTGVSLALSPDGFVVVGLHEGGWEIPEGRLEIRILRMSDGIEIEGRSSLVKVSQITTSQAYGHSEHPWPMVWVFR